MKSRSEQWSLEDPFDDDGEPVVVCPECEGTGRSDELIEDEDDSEIFGDCKFCCGFGRLDW